jgi:AcrR family transcriptional regulator
VLPNSKSRLRRGKPLPRGRHGLSPRAVQTSQKERLTQAMLDLVAAHGYARTTVPEIAAMARVSPNAFYGFFSDKADCFLAALSQQASMLLAELNAAATVGDWIERLSNGLDAYLKWWQERPQVTWAYFVEMPTVGARAVEQRSRAYGPFAEMFARVAAAARKQQPRLRALPGFVPGMLVISITEYVAAEVRAGRTGGLIRLKDDLLFYLVKLLADDATARRL